MTTPVAPVDDRLFVRTRSRGKSTRCRASASSGARAQRVVRPTTLELAPISNAMGGVARDELAMLVHDLRNPLATVSVYSQLLLQDAQTDTLRERVSTIQEAAQRLERLLNQVAALREQRASFAGVQKTDVVEVVRHISSGANRVRVTSQESEMVGYWDVVELERLVANLIDNALKYSPDGRPVDVTLGTSDGGVVITVADQGIGIPCADLPRVFDRGYRATNAKATFKGDGLGLATVRRIVDAQHGSMTIASEEGIGTTVTVWLPSARVAENSWHMLATEAVAA